MQNYFTIKKMIFLLFFLQFIYCKKEVKKNKEVSPIRKEHKKATQDSGNSVIEDTFAKNEIVTLDEDNIYNVRIEKIDSIQFFKAKEQAPKPHAKPTKITDFNTAKKMLKGVVKFGSSLSGEDGVHTIYFKNGKKYVYNDIGGFIAYYPNENILLCEGGHSIDVSFNLKNGKQTEQTGNPELMVTSPSKEFRLNAFFGGQLCNINFIQKKIHNEYENIIDLDKYFHPKADYILCIAKDAFWINDTTLFYREPSFLHKNHYFKVMFDRSEKYITAQSGLNYRTAPKGEILGKFDYGEKVEVIKYTDIVDAINDEGKTIRDKWVGVRYKSDTVYVFDAFLTKSLKTKKYHWEDELCAYTGEFNPEKYTKEEIDECYKIIFHHYFYSLTSPSVFKSSDIEKLNINNLKEEFSTKMNEVQNLDLPKTGKWEEFRRKIIQELEEAYKLYLIEYEAYQTKNFSVLNKFWKSDALLKKYARALQGSDDELLEVWEGFMLERAKKNGSPERVKQEFREQRNSDNWKEYAQIDIMTFGWGNQANGYINRFQGDKHRKEFDSLFTVTQEIECDEP